MGGKESKMAYRRKNREHKKVPLIDSAKALYTPGVPNTAYQHMVTPIASSIEGKYSCNVVEPGEYEVIKDGTKLVDCSSGEVEMRNGKVGVKYEKDREVLWTQLVRWRRKKSARSVVQEIGRDSWNLCP